jgi:hypothetical protein
MIRGDVSYDDDCTNQSDTKGYRMYDKEVIARSQTRSHPLPKLNVWIS